MQVRARSTTGHLQTWHDLCMSLYPSVCMPCGLPDLTPTHLCLTPACAAAAGAWCQPSAPGRQGPQTCLGTVQHGHTPWLYRRAIGLGQQRLCCQHGAGGVCSRSSGDEGPQQVADGRSDRSCPPVVTYGEAHSRAWAALAWCWQLTQCGSACTAELMHRGMRHAVGPTCSTLQGCQQVAVMRQVLQRNKVQGLLRAGGIWAKGHIRLSCCRRGSHSDFSGIPARLHCQRCWRGLPGAASSTRNVCINMMNVHRSIADA